jgi:hypothetical protein
MALAVTDKLSATNMAHARGEIRRRSTRDLVTEIARTASQLARTEVELARAEVRKDLRQGMTMAGGLGVAGLCGILALNFLLLALVLGLAEAGVWRGWLGAIIVAGVMLAIGAVAGILGWDRRVRPLQATRRSLQEGVKWAKERVT